MTRVICPSKQLPTTLYSLRDELTVQDGLIVRGQRVVIPASLQKQMKKQTSLIAHGKRIMSETSARIHLLAQNASKE